VPSRAKPRRLFGDKLQVARREIQYMVELGILRPSKSEWASPLHVAPKADGGWRPCGDFRHLNSVTVPDRYPLPHVQDFVTTLHGAKVFSKIDLVRAFHQIPLASDAVPKCAITTPFGLYEFLRMPFGLCNAAQTFQRFMDKVVAGLEGIYVYIDDILVVSSTDEEHVKRLEALFQRLRRFGLVVNPIKSLLGAHQVQFLGVHLDAAGVRPLDDRITVIRNFPVPATYANLTEFLGLVNFYHRFIPRCSDIARPLHALVTTGRAAGTGKSITVADWTSAHANAFDGLKAAISEVATLAYPNPDLPTRLATDASDVAVGAVLEQKEGPSWRPVAFFSKSLKGPELKYSAYDRELLAIKLALAHFRHIVEGLPPALFHVATDHRPLTSTKPFAPSNKGRTQADRVERTWQFISELTTDIRHLPGKDNVVADALSRAPVSAVTSINLMKFIADAQQEAGMHPSPFEPWPSHWVVVEEQGCDIVVDKRGPLLRPVVPDAARRAVFDAVHGLAHVGVKATVKAISKNFVWHSMSSDIKNWVRTCSSCQASKILKHNATPHAAFQPPTAKFEALHIDIVGPLPPSQGHRYILTVVDRFSRWPAAIPMPDMSAATCASALVRGWVQHYGTPLSVVTDRGRQFTSALWAELMALLGTAHSLTTAYHPQANGLVERFHRQLKGSLMARCAATDSWYSDLPLVMLGLRAAVKEDLGCSAADIVYGESIRLPGASLTSGAADRGSAVASEEYVSALRRSMADRVYTAPTWHGSDNAAAQPLPGFSTCSHVYVLVSSVKAPLQRPYTGPFLVLSRTDKAVTIRKHDGSVDTVTTDRVKPAFTDDAILASTDPGASGAQLQTRYGRPVRPPPRYQALRVPTPAFAGLPVSDAERFALERAAAVPIPLLGVPEYPDDAIYDGPVLPLNNT